MSRVDDLFFFVVCRNSLLAYRAEELPRGEPILRRETPQGLRLFARSC